MSILVLPENADIQHWAADRQNEVPGSHISAQGSTGIQNVGKSKQCYHTALKVQQSELMGSYLEQGDLCQQLGASL